MKLPRPEKQVAHVTLKLRGSALRKRVIGHASFPISSAMGGTRRELGMELTSFGGDVCGQLSLKLRVEEMGVLVEDWVALGQGLTSLEGMPPTRSGVSVSSPSSVKSGGSKRGSFSPSFLDLPRLHIGPSPSRIAAVPSPRGASVATRIRFHGADGAGGTVCLLYTSPSPRDRQKSRMPSSA